MRPGRRCGLGCVVDVVFVSVIVAVFALDLGDAARCGEVVTAEYVVGLIIVAALVIYLIVALVFPERF